MGSGWGSELGLRPGAPRRMECRDDPGEWGGEEAGRNQMGTFAIYGFYLVTRLLSCTACYIFVNDTPALSALPACTSFRWEDSPGGRRDTGHYVGL